MNWEGEIQVSFPDLLQIFCENLIKSLKYAFRADWEMNFTTMQNVKVQGGEKKKKKVVLNQDELWHIALQ